MLKEKIEDLQIIAGNESVKYHSIYDDIISIKDLLEKIEVRLHLKEQNSDNNSSLNI
jgi:hypothetical protein